MDIQPTLANRKCHLNNPTLKSERAKTPKTKYKS